MFGTVISQGDRSAGDESFGRPVTLSIFSESSSDGYCFPCTVNLSHDKLSPDKKSRANCPMTDCPTIEKVPRQNVPWTRLSRKSKYAWTWFLVSHEASFSGFVFFFWFLRLTSWTDIHCDGGSSFDQNSRQKGRLLVCSQELNLHIASRRWRQVPSRSGDVETERAMADCTLLATKSWRRPLIIICQIKLKCWFWPKGWH